MKTSDLHKLKLRLLKENPYSDFNMLNMKQVLWNLALNHLDQLIEIVDDTEKYQIEVWVKPTSQEGRRDLLRIMTAMEKSPVTISEISEVLNTDKSYVKKIVAGLLFAGFLQKFNYFNITLQQAMDSQKDKKMVQTLDNVLSRRAAGEKPKLQTSSSIPISLLKKKSGSGNKIVESKKSVNITDKKKPSTEKQGFLSRLRKKFGL